MGGFHWIVENWVTALNTVGVVSGLFFTAASFRSEAKTRRVANLLTITKNHRDIWADFYRNPELARVLDVSADVAKQPVTRDEEIFVNLVILHLSSVFTRSRMNSSPIRKGCAGMCGSSSRCQFHRRSGTG